MACLIWSTNAVPYVNDVDVMVVVWMQHTILNTSQNTTQTTMLKQWWLSTACSTDELERFLIDSIA